VRRIALLLLCATVLPIIPLLAAGEQPRVQRVVILKVDGLPDGFPGSSFGGSGAS